MRELFDSLLDGSYIGEYGEEIVALLVKYENPLINKIETINGDPMHSCFLITVLKAFLTIKPFFEQESPCQKIQNPSYIFAAARKSEKCTLCSTVW